ncbi:hypothetical protein [Pseudooceanicola sp. MF1-13]|uniref:hypothetical protein n=1 Tax=Pseudooceanicola sp. MF1-13 TaxID=3379095 RepID=UPI003892127A
MTQPHLHGAQSRHRKLFELLRQENLAARNITVKMMQRAAPPAPKAKADLAQIAKMAEESLMV